MGDNTLFLLQQSAQKLEGIHSGKRFADQPVEFVSEPGSPVPFRISGGDQFGLDSGLVVVRGDFNVDDDDSNDFLDGTDEEMVCDENNSDWDDRTSFFSGDDGQQRGLLEDSEWPQHPVSIPWNFQTQQQQPDTTTDDRTNTTVEQDHQLAQKSVRRRHKNKQAVLSEIEDCTDDELATLFNSTTTSESRGTRLLHLQHNNNKTLHNTKYINKQGAPAQPPTHKKIPSSSKKTAAAKRPLQHTNNHRTQPHHSNNSSAHKMGTRLIDPDVQQVSVEMQEDSESQPHTPVIGNNGVQLVRNWIAREQIQPHIPLMTLHTTPPNQILTAASSTSSTIEQISGSGQGESELNSEDSEEQYFDDYSVHFPKGSAPSQHPLLANLPNLHQLNDSSLLSIESPLIPPQRRFTLLDAIHQMQKQQQNISNQPPSLAVEETLTTDNDLQNVNALDRITLPQELAKESAGPKEVQQQVVEPIEHQKENPPKLEPPQLETEEDQQLRLPQQSSTKPQKTSPRYPLRLTNKSEPHSRGLPKERRSSTTSSRDSFGMHMQQQGSVKPKDELSTAVEKFASFLSISEGKLGQQGWGWGSPNVVNMDALLTDLTAEVDSILNGFS